jgi:hypothetical protein
MPPSDAPHKPGLLPDTGTGTGTGPGPGPGHREVRPGTAVVRLETTHDRRGVLDGAWWPRSRDIGEELPALVSALTEHIGPVTRVGLDAGAWQHLPTRMVIDDRVVHLDSFPVGDGTVLITRGAQDHFSLLVIPPDASPEAAHAAMAAAVRPDDARPAEQILIDTGATPAPPEPASGSAPGPADEAPRSPGSGQGD